MNPWMNYIMNYELWLDDRIRISVFEYHGHGSVASIFTLLCFAYSFTSAYWQTWICWGKPRFENIHEWEGEAIESQWGNRWGNHACEWQLCRDFAVWTAGSWWCRVSNFRRHPQGFAKIQGLYQPIPCIVGQKEFEHHPWSEIATCTERQKSSLWCSWSSTSFASGTIVRHFAFDAGTAQKDEQGEHTIEHQMATVARETQWKDAWLGPCLDHWQSGASAYERTICRSQLCRSHWF